MKDRLSNEFKKNVYLKPDEYLNGWARKCGWKATIVYDSLWRHADKNRSCFPSIKLMAEEHGVSRDTIIRGLKTLIAFKLVSKSPKRSKSGKFLHNTYVLNDKNKWKDASKSLTATRSSKSLTAYNQVAHSDCKDTHNKDTHTLSIQKKYLHPLKANIDEEYLQALAERNNVPLSFVKSKLDDMVLWHEENPFKNKKINWKATLAKWVKTDALKIKDRSGYANRTRGIDATDL